MVTTKVKYMKIMLSVILDMTLPLYFRIINKRSIIKVCL